MQQNLVAREEHQPELGRVDEELAHPSDANKNKILNRQKFFTSVQKPVSAVPRGQPPFARDGMVERRKAANPNKDPELQAEKKAAKQERDALRKRAEEIKRASWKYGLGAAGVIIAVACLYSLVTISRATIVTLPLDDQAQLKEASCSTQCRTPCATRDAHARPPLGTSLEASRVQPRWRAAPLCSAANPTHTCFVFAQVFFGGEPWMLLCANENTTLSEGFLGASKRMSVTSSVKFGAIDCNGKLPSNKTFWQRFGQVPKAFSSSQPVGFLFANNNEPLAIPDKYINDAKKLSKWAEQHRLVSDRALTCPVDTPHPRAFQSL